MSIADQQVAIAFKKPGQVIEQGWLKEALKTTTAISFTLVDADGDLGTDSLLEGITFEEVNRVQEAYREHPIVVAFHHYSKETLAEDYQPLTIFEDDSGKVQLVAFIDAEKISGFDEGGNNHTAAFNAVLKYLVPKLEEIANKHDGDMDGFMELLDVENEVLKREITSIGEGNVTVLFFARNNMIRTFSRNQDEQHYPWGYASRSLGLTPVMGTAEPTKKKASLFNRPGKQELPRGDQISTEPVKPITSVPTTPSQKVVAKVEEAINKPDETPPVMTSYSYHEAKSIDARKASYEERRTWHKAISGVCPDNYKKLDGRWHISIDRYSKAVKAGLLNPKKDFKDLGTSIKDTTVKHIPDDKTVLQVSDPKFLPVIPPETRKKLEALHLQFMENPSTMDIDKINELETKWSNYAQQLGLDMETTFKLDQDQILKIATLGLKDGEVNEGAQAITLLALNWRALYLTLLNRTSTIADKKDDESVHANTDTAAEESIEPPKETAPTPKKKSLFNRKVA